jgi:hypothetical protein
MNFEDDKVVYGQKATAQNSEAFENNNMAQATNAIECLLMPPPAFAPAPASSNEMDIESLCLPQDFKAMTEVDQVVTSVPFSKPDKEWFFRIHPHFTRFMAVLSEKKENYVIVPKLVPELGSEVKKKLIVPGITRQGKLFFWPLKVEAEKGLDDWSKSALIGMETAKGKWTKLTSNMDGGYYEVFTAKGNLGEPNWPETGLVDLFSLALRNRVISSMDHPVIKRLHGEL